MKKFWLLALLLWVVGGYEKSYAQKVAQQDVNVWLRVKSECLKKKKKENFYHIQIYNGPDLKEAKAALLKFKEAYPNAKAFIVWENPEYKVWTGEYYTRFEVERALRLVQEQFPEALIVYPRVR